jgi:hypothetical protein
VSDNRVTWAVNTTRNYLQDEDKIDTTVSVVYLLREDVRYMFRRFVDRHQASYKKNQTKFLNCIVLIWIHIL